MKKLIVAISLVTFVLFVYTASANNVNQDKPKSAVSVEKKTTKDGKHKCSKHTAKKGKKCCKKPCKKTTKKGKKCNHSKSAHHKKCSGAKK